METVFSGSDIKNMKFERFIKWINSNGAIYNKINFPVYFPELRTTGISAKCNIGPLEAFIYIPKKLIIDSNIAEKSLKDFYSRNIELVEESYEISLTSLIIFILFEVLKGEKSFWFPFFDLMEDSMIPVSYSTDELNEFQDEYFVDEILDDILEKKQFYSIFEKAISEEKKRGFLENFEIEKLNYELFLKIDTFCQTRNFYGTEKQSLIVPLADFFNHSEVDTDFQIFDGDNGVTKLSLQPTDNKHEYLFKTSFLDFYEQTQYNEIDHHFLEEAKKRNNEIFESTEITNNNLINDGKVDLTYVNDDESFDEDSSVITRVLKQYKRTKKAEKIKFNEADYYDESNKELIVCINEELILRDNDYFIISTGKSQIFHKDSQVFIHYGSYSNQYLLSCYGFAYENNSHDKVKMRLKFPKFDENEKYFRYLKYILPKSYKDDYGFYILKFNMIYDGICIDLVKYFTFKWHYDSGKIDDLLIYKFDIQTEILIIKNCIKEIENYIKKKEEVTSLDDDKKMLEEVKQRGGNFKLLFALIYRVSNKKILHRNLFFFKLLLEIIEEGYEIGFNKTHLNFENEVTKILNREILKEYFKLRLIKIPD